jgi:hypothetical protein
MKATIVIALLTVCIIAISLRGQPATRSAAPPAYEYKVMPLAELVAGSDDAMKKIGAMSVFVPGQAQRTDLDVTDYQAAFDRLAAQGWEPVTVNRSNYWVLRRLKP